MALIRTPVLGPRLPPLPTGIPEEMGLWPQNSHRTACENKADITHLILALVPSAISVDPDCRSLLPLFAFDASVLITCPFKQSFSFVQTVSADTVRIDRRFISVEMFFVPRPADGQLASLPSQRSSVEARKRQRFPTWTAGIDPRRAFVRRVRGCILRSLAASSVSSSGSKSL